MSQHDIDALEALFASGAPAFKFEEIGDKVTGTITNLDVRQQTDFDSGEPKFWDDGKPMMEIVITLATSLRDKEIEDDDGERRVFCRGAMMTAFRQAVRKAKDSKPRVGAKVTVTYSGDGEAKKARFNPPKLYTVTYEPPDGMDDLFGDDDEPMGKGEEADQMAALANLSPEQLAAAIAAATK
jgi:hypothetical protein